MSTPLDVVFKLDLYQNRQTDLQDHASTPPPLLQSCQIACFSNEFVVDILHLVGDVLPAELQDRCTGLRAHLGEKVGVLHERIESLSKKAGTAWNQVAGLRVMHYRCQSPRASCHNRCATRQ